MVLRVWDVINEQDFLILEQMAFASFSYYKVHEQVPEHYFQYSPYQYQPNNSFEFGNEKRGRGFIL